MTKSGNRFSRSRREFVQGLAAAGMVAALPHAVLGDSPLVEPAVLTGKRFELAIEYLPVNLTGRRTLATVVNRSIPGPILRWREGDTVEIAVTNHLSEYSSIHWHGIRAPSEMDGVPGLSFPGIAPNETFHYRIPVVQNGTYWYHSHSAFQEQTGLLGALIIDPESADPIESDRDYVVILSDWTDSNPNGIFSNLRKQSDYYNYNKRTAGTFFSNVKGQGLGATISNRLVWGRTDMSPTDLADVTAATYSYLINGKSPAANWTALFDRGQRVRLRFINASSMTLFDVRIPGLKMTVVQADGNAVQPVTVDEFRFASAETYDVIVQPMEDIAYTIFAQPISRGGFARATLAPRPGMTAQIPPLDPVPMRTMVDMGMAMTNASMKSEKMGGMSGETVNQSDSMASAPSGSEVNSRNDCVAGDKVCRAISIGEFDAIAKKPFPQPGPQSVRYVPLPTDVYPAPEVVRPNLTVGPYVTMVTKNPAARLNDPGDGLDGNGRRVLTYADLRALYPGVDGRPPSREIELHLTGNMDRYAWGFDGYRFSQAEPVNVKLGERVRIVLVNDTMMEHPIHLHGLWGELENGLDEYRPFKHTIMVKPSERIGYLVSADTTGRWAYHCHLLYHMKAGMFRAVIVS